MTLAASTTSADILAHARVASIKLHYVSKVCARKPEHAAAVGYDLKDVTADRDVKVAQAIAAGFTLDEIEGRVHEGH
jgi:hypothetical protein